MCVWGGLLQAVLYRNFLKQPNPVEMGVLDVIQISIAERKDFLVLAFYSYPLHGFALLRYPEPSISIEVVVILETLFPYLCLL